MKFAGQTQDHPLASLAQFKQIKPEGGDFVTAALAAGGVQNPMLTMASMGVSADHWCVPVDASDGKATVEAEIESPSGHQALKYSTIQIESFETGNKNKFKNAQEESNFLDGLLSTAEPSAAASRNGIRYRIPDRQSKIRYH